MKSLIMKLCFGSELLPLKFSSNQIQGNHECAIYDTLSQLSVTPVTLVTALTFNSQTVIEMHGSAI